MGGEGEHILSRFDDDLQGLRKLTLETGALARSQVQQAVNALLEGDLTDAYQVCTREKRLDQMDMEGQELTIRLLAVHHPVARDLRYIIALSRSISDLERAGDEAEKIARLVIAGLEDEHRFVDLMLFDAAKDLMCMVTGMLSRSLDSLQQGDVNGAVGVIQSVKRVEGYLDAANRQLATYMLQDTRNMKMVMDALVVLKSLERVGGHAANIAESLILYVTGKDVRYIKAEHLSEGYLDPA